jgi:hypothetical protein
MNRSVGKGSGVRNETSPPCSIAYAYVRIRRLVRWGGRL